MFTGLIQQICSVTSLTPAAGGATLTIDLAQAAGQVKIGLPRLASGDAKAGDSIAINGVCLTVAKLAGNLAAFDLSAETLAKTNLGRLTPGSKVNIELALRAGDRFGGHFVLGHVDGTATIRKIEKKGEFAKITFSTPKELLNQLLPRGSVAIDGISLTIAELNTDGFTIVVIPQTLRKTTLGDAKINQITNLEIDIITKAVRRYLGKLPLPESGLTIEDLKQQGF
jgi:riboflavin synthase